MNDREKEYLIEPGAGLEGPDCLGWFRLDLPLVIRFFVLSRVSLPFPSMSMSMPSLPMNLPRLGLCLDPFKSRARCIRCFSNCQSAPGPRIARHGLAYSSSYGGRFRPTSQNRFRSDIASETDGSPVNHAPARSAAPHTTAFDTHAFHQRLQDLGLASVQAEALLAATSAVIATSIGDFQRSCVSREEADRQLYTQKVFLLPHLADNH